MLQLWIFVSGGDEVETFRDIAVAVIQAVERVFVFDLEVDVVLRNWDFRDEPPELVAPGQFASRSLRMVDRSHAIVGILGETIPRTTSKEIKRAVGRFAAGQTDRVWIFIDKSKKSRRHNSFVARIRRTLKMQIVYQSYDDELDFQRKMFVALTPLVIRKAIRDDVSQPADAQR